MKLKEIEVRLTTLSKRLDDLHFIVQLEIPPSEYKVYYCAECGNPFVLNKSQNERRQTRTFYCSIGHSNIFK